ncbi:MAG: ABC transporter ATP-binding protein [Clostridiales bacterium]|nr:ABC transporter ATP-binding protein [Clostridiales bacterium]
MSDTRQANVKRHLLDIQHLTVYYGYVQALEDISIHVDEGEIVTLIGANGAGKTTTLMSVSGLTEKAEGHIFIDGQDVTRAAPDRVVRLGVSHVPEGRKIFPQLTVYENLIAGTFGKKGITKGEIANLIERNYDLFPRLKERAGQAGGSLSGGEQQMLAIARGLMMDPRLIMLDEPSLGLAPIVVEEIFELIETIRKQGKTVLLIEQNASAALAVADRGYVLETGRVTLTGTGKELLANPEVRKAYLGM